MPVLWLAVKTVIETPTFQKQADKIWCEDDRLTFISFISENSEQGDVISGTQGLRKIRWHTGQSGKRSGVRIIYFKQNEQDVIYLLAIYSKSKKENTTHKELKQVKKEI